MQVNLARMVEAVFRKEPSFSAYVLKDFKGQRVMKKVPQYVFIMINQTQGVTSMKLVCFPGKLSFGKCFGEKTGKNSLERCFIRGSEN